MRLQNILPVHVRRVINGMTKRGLAPSTVRQCWCVLHALFKCAVESNIIGRNPAADVPVPRLVKRNFSIIDRDMFPVFVDAAGQTSFPDVFIFLLLTGLRVSEVRGLRWADVDMDSHTLRVERQLIEQTGLPASLGIPKNGEVRMIQLPAGAVDVLKAHRVHQLEERIAAGPAWAETGINVDLVFRMKNGSYINHTAIHSAFAVLRDSLGMPNLRIHDLRHSYAVAALRAGVDVKTVQHNLGHKQAAITLDIYAAYTSDAGRDGAAKVDIYWQNALKNG